LFACGPRTCSACLQVLLGNVRPCPPPELASIIPPAAAQQQQQQHDPPLSPAAAAAAWAGSAEGLSRLSKLLRPGLLLEYRRGKQGGAWLPALLLHSSLARPSLSRQLADLSTQPGNAAGGGRVTLAGLVSACEQLAGSSREGGVVAAWQPPRPEERVLTLQLLGGTYDVSGLACKLAWGRGGEGCALLLLLLKFAVEHICCC
jgi:hypothetical protein